MEFDEYPYQTKIELVAHWELRNEVAEYYRKKQEKEMKNRKL